jgi:hypothetical protein
MCCTAADYWGPEKPTLKLEAYSRHGINVSNITAPDFKEAETGQVLLDRWV